MRISQLINDLQQVQSNEGDIPVGINVEEDELIVYDFYIAVNTNRVGEKAFRECEIVL